MSDASAAAALAELLGIMSSLRDPTTGCPWDREQDFASIAPYTLEEAHEVADAIERQDWVQLRDELGDLLFQVVVHERLAEERAWFDFAAVAQGISEKLQRRHPHVFARESKDATDPEILSRDWERAKASERASRGAAGALDGVALALPALTRATKLGRRAGRVGFDWQDADAVANKVREEFAELSAARTAGASPAVVEEFGDLLFSVAQFGRHLGLDPEAALRAANRKFERRFASMEKALAAAGGDPAASTAADWELLWNAAKLAE